ncbi:MAG: hypothetical protein JXR37_22420 [Kiritimatiellae bacterium]|nr:hypothetical protein [Kiritimatiellia bacterium]
MTRHVQNLLLACLALSLAAPVAPCAAAAFTSGLDQTHINHTALQPEEVDIWHGEPDRQYLHGVWTLWKVPDEAGVPKEDLRQKPFAWWKKNLGEKGQPQIVPLDWHRNYQRQSGLGDHHPSAQAGFYGVTLSVPGAFRDRRVILHFDWVHCECEVFVNGKRAGAHKNLSTRARRCDSKFFEDFEIDITPYLDPGKPFELNVLAFTVEPGQLWAATVPEVGGIVGPVWIDYRPEAFVRELYLAPDIEKSVLNMDLVRDAGPQAPRVSEWTFEIRPWQGPHMITLAQLRSRVQWRQNRARVTVPMPGAVRWDTESPFLYRLEIRDEQGRVVGRERFGFREFRAEGNAFLLNGDSVWLRGILWHTRPNTASRMDLNYNAGGYVRRWLEVVKRHGNVNHIRIHNGGMSPIFFHVCDELGLLVSDEFDIPSVPLAADDPRRRIDYIAKVRIKSLFDDQGEISTEAKDRFRAMVRGDHNHPCVIMFNTANERAPSDAFYKYAESFYEVVHATDRQNRPVGSWGSGPHLEAAATCRKIPTDYFDMHYGSREEYEHSKEKAHLGDIPFINGEAVYKLVRMHHLKWLHERFDQGATPDEVYFEWIANRGKWNSNLVYKHGETLGEIGIRAFRDNATYQRRFARRFKQLVERERREFDFLQGIALLGKDDNYLWRDSWNADKTAKSVEVLPYVKELGVAFAPLWIGERPFAKNWFPGQTIELKALVHNGTTRTDEKLTARAVLLDAKGAALAECSAPVGTVQPDERRDVAFSVPVPRDAQAQETHLELWLQRDGEEVFRNPYEVRILAPSAVSNGGVPAGIAVYEPNGAGDGVRVCALLRTAGVRAVPVASIHDALKADRIIVAPDALDEQMEVSNRELRAWVEAGGKLVVLEQSYPGTLPFLSEYRYVAPQAQAYADVLKAEHPVFAGLPPEAFRDWGGNGTLFRQWVNKDVDDLDKTVLAAEASQVARGAMGFGMLVAEAGVGKGAVLLSQLRAAEYYGKDAAATRYLNNVLSYASSPAFGKNAVPVAGERKHLRYYAAARCFDIPVVARANSPLWDNNVEADGEGGFADLGRAHLNPMQRKTYRIHGVNYKVAKESEGKGKNCIVLGGSIRPNLTKQVTDIPVGKRLESIGFLHTGMWIVGANGRNKRPEPGTKLGAYTIRYEDGGTVEFPILHGVNVTDWFDRHELPEAKIGLMPKTADGMTRALYVARWRNPNPGKMIKSIDMSSTGEGILALFAATGVLPE